jgi:hypothetical protein
MTDINDLVRKANAAREFTVPVGSATYTLRLPTEHEKNMASLRARGPGAAADPAFPALLIRKLLEQSIVAWSGVTCEMLAPGGGAEVAELVPGAAALLLDADPATAQALQDAFVARTMERQRHVEEQQKN